MVIYFFLLFDFKGIVLAQNRRQEERAMVFGQWDDIVKVKGLDFMIFQRRDDF
jgi:hypothetical protein